MVAAEIEQLKRNWVDGRSRDGWIAGKEGVNQRLRIGRIATIGAGKNRERSGTNKGSRRKSTPLPRPLVIDEKETQTGVLTNWSAQAAAEDILFHHRPRLAIALLEEFVGI